MTFVLLVTIIRQSVASMEAIVKTSTSIPTALPLFHHGLEMVFAMVVTTIRPSVASTEAIVLVFWPGVASMEAIVLVARPSLLVEMFLYEQLHLSSFLQFYGCIDSCRMIYD